MKSANRGFPPPAFSFPPPLPLHTLPLFIFSFSLFRPIRLVCVSESVSVCVCVRPPSRPLPPRAILSIVVCRELPLVGGEALRMLATFIQSYER